MTFGNDFRPSKYRHVPRNSGDKRMNRSPVSMKLGQPILRGTTKYAAMAMAGHGAGPARLPKSSTAPRVQPWICPPLPRDSAGQLPTGSVRVLCSTRCSGEYASGNFAAPRRSPAARQTAQRHLKVELCSRRHGEPYDAGSKDCHPANNDAWLRNTISNRLPKWGRRKDVGDRYKNWVRATVNLLPTSQSPKQRSRRSRLRNH